MSSVIVSFLEKLGRDPKLRSDTKSKPEECLSAAGIDPSLRAAIFDANARDLEILLGTRTNVCCLIHTPEEHEDEPEDDQEDTDDDDGKDDNKPASVQPAFRRVAATT